MFHSARAYALAIASGLASPAAIATDVYTGVAAVQEYDQRYDKLPGTIEVDSGARLHLGWQFARDGSIELAFHDFGSAASTNNASAPVSDFGLDTETDGWSLGVRYVAPVDWHVKPFAKLGWFWFDENGSELTIIGTRRFSRSTDGLAAELGVRFEFNDRFALRTATGGDFEIGSSHE
jgi:outer membrane autotransporter protein